MTQIRYNFPTGNNTDAATTANTGSSFPIVTGGTLNISTVQALIGTRSLLMVATTTSGACYLSMAIGVPTAVNTDIYVFVTAAPSGATQVLFISAGTSQRVSVELNANMTVTLRDDAFAAIWTSTYVIPLNTWVRIAMYATSSATVGEVRAAVYLGHSSTPTSGGDSTLLTGRNTGIGWDNLRVGMKCSTGTMTGTAYLGSWSYDNAATGMPVAYGLPIANAGSDVSGVEPGKTITINGSASDPVVGSITNWNYSVSPSGTLVGTGATRTLVAPPTLTGQTFTVTLVITNTGGSTSTDTMTIGVNPASRRVKIGGVMTPVFSRPMGG